MKQETNTIKIMQAKLITTGRGVPLEMERLGDFDKSPPPLITVKLLHYIL